MNHLKFALLAIVVGGTMMANASAAILAKNILEIKDRFDKAGALTCSKPMAETLNFLAKGRPLAYIAHWIKKDPEKNAISTDFVMGGTKESYSMSGVVTLIPSGKQCVGSYSYSWVAPAQNCKVYIEKEGFRAENWVEDLTDDNGDGGKVYFLSPKESTISLIFNDVAGGCSVTKIETLTMTPN